MIWIRNLLINVLLITALLDLVSCRQPTAPTLQVDKSALGDKGMVVTAHPIASEIGLDILKAGGNAADAVIAVQFALAVVYPRAGNLGGGGFLLYRDSTGQITSLDYREKAPLAANRNMYLDSTGHVIQGLSLNGILSAGVPGSVAGMYATYQKFGHLLPWSKLVEPAIQLAREGFRLSALDAKILNESRESFLKHNAYPLPFVRKEPWKEGDLLIQKDLAATLQRIADEGADGFYHGANAKVLGAFCEHHHGIITIKDLAAYRAIWREPIHTQWRDCDIYAMGLPSSGGILISQILKMIDQELVDSLGYRNIQNVHLVVEAERRAFSDRAVYLGDSDFIPVPVDSLLNDQYLTAKFSDFDKNRATPSGNITANASRFSREHYETTHISIVDAHGQAASVTTTLNNNFGSKVWVPGAGYFLNDEMDDFSSKPGEPNLFGLIGGEANAIAPGKRMLSSMTPTIIEKNGRLFLVLGSPGGSTIITSVLQVMLNVETFDIPLYDAVAALRYHHQWLPDEITYEKGAFSPSLEDSLKMMGYKLHSIEKIGAVEAILMDANGKLHGAADPRGEDHAAGW
jgi:gamma-glutamyltranspeptidase/glutathione hydrolase